MFRCSGVTKKGHLVRFLSSYYFMSFFFKMMALFLKVRLTSCQELFKNYYGGGRVVKNDSLLKWSARQHHWRNRRLHVKPVTSLAWLDSVCFRSSSAADSLAGGGGKKRRGGRFKAQSSKIARLQPSWWCEFVGFKLWADFGRWISSLVNTQSKCGHWHIYDKSHAFVFFWDLSITHFQVLPTERPFFRSASSSLLLLLLSRCWDQETKTKMEDQHQFCPFQRDGGSSVLCFAVVKSSPLYNN